MQDRVKNRVRASIVLLCKIEYELLSKPVILEIMQIQNLCFE